MLGGGVGRRGSTAAARTAEIASAALDVLRKSISVERLAWMDRLVANHGVRRALTAADLEAAHAAGQPAVVMDIEGLDFLEMKLERLEGAHQRGVRHAQLVHYTP